MAVSAWVIYNNFKLLLGTRAINLDADKFDLHLFTSAASASISEFTLTTWTELTGEVASTGDYSRAGASRGTTYSAGDSAKQKRFDMSDIVFTASTASIIDIKFALVVHRATTTASAKDPTNQVCMFSQLTATEFPLNTGSTLTISTPAADGIFELL